MNTQLHVHVLHQKPQHRPYLVADKLDPNGWDEKKSSVGF